MNCTVDYPVFCPPVEAGGSAAVVGIVLFVVVWIAIAAFFITSRASKKASDDHVETPGGLFLSKEYLKDVERLRRKAREEVDREDGMQAHDSQGAPVSGIALPGDLTEREAALVQKFIAELRREQDVSAADGSHAEPPSGLSTRKPTVRRNPRSFQDWQGSASGKVREHRTV